MSTFFAEYPPKGSNNVVTSLDGMTGAITLIAGANITITDGLGTITIASTGGSGANQFLSNLLSPTAINQILNFDTGTTGIIQTKNDNTANTQDMEVLSGASTGFNSGNIVSYTGNAESSGAQIVQTGIAASGTSGSITLQSGNAATTSGNILLSIGTGGTNGLIKLQPNNGTITPGYVWTATDASGSGDWLPGGGSGLQSINTDTTAAQTLSVGTAGTDFAIVDAGGGSHVFNLPTASASNRGALSSTDWTTFNNKFNLPALTAGSVLFSNGTTIAQDNAAFYWDETGKSLEIGSILGPPGTVPFGLTTQRNDTDASAEAGSFFAGHNSFATVNSGALNVAGLFEQKSQVDAGVTTSAGAGVIFNAFRNSGSSDAGSLGFLVGAFGGSHQIGTDPAATTDIVAGVLSQVDVTSGNANSAADFYALGGDVTGGTITNLFGIYISPSTGGTKSNWLSGVALVGGSSYAAPTSTLQVNGDFSASKTVTDTGVAAATVTGTSNTTVSGSNTTLGINGVASGTVQVGAVNDKTIGGMNFAVTRGDGTDQGNLSTMTGANTLIFHNSDAAGTTDQVYGMSTLFFSTQGTVTDLYDFFSQRVPSGSGVVTNHYGVYINYDSATPVKNWLSGITQMGGTSFSPAASTILDLQSTTGALLVPRMSTADRTGLTPSEGMIIYDTDDTAIEGYMGGTWVTLGTGGGPAANQALSNLTNPTAINQTLNFDTGTTGIVQTKDDNTANTQDMEILSGASTGFNSGNIVSYTGNAEASGAQIVQTGIGASSTSGSITLQSGSAATISGNILLSIGNGGSSNGFIQLQPNAGSITAGQVWTATDSSGSGNWAAPTFVGARARLTTTPSLPASADTDIIFDAVDYDTNSAYNASTGEYTIPSTGYYNLDSCIFTGPSSAFTNSDGCIYYIFVNGTVRTTVSGAFATGSGTSFYSTMTASTQLQLTAGDVVKWVMFASVATAVFSTSPTPNWFTISKIG